MTRSGAAAPSPPPPPPPPSSALPPGTPSVPPVPWSLPAAAGTASGIALDAAGVPFALLLAPGALALLGLLPRASRDDARLRSGRDDARLRTRGARRPSLLLLLALLALPVGAARHHAWDARPDPLAGALGREGSWTVVSDGRFVRILEPVRGRAAVSPAGALPPGRGVARGVLERPSGARNPGGFDHAGWLRRRGATAVLRVEGAREWRGAGSLAGPAGLRARLAEGVARGLPEREAALLLAMTLGVRDGLGELQDVFADAGLAHVLALSGLHVGVLLAALERLLRPLGGARYPVMLLALVGFVALVGSSPSVLRASLMAGAALLSLARGTGRIEPLPALSLAALASLLLAPAWLFDLSFGLSYLAVGGILAFAPPLLARALPRGGRGLAWWRPRVLVLGGLAVSLAAQLPSASVVAGTFGRVPVLSPLPNVPAVPLAGLLVPLGFAKGLLDVLHPALAAPLGPPARALAALLIAVAEAGARLPAPRWAEVGPAGHVAWAVAVAAAALALRGLLRPRRAALLVALSAWSASLGGLPPPELIAIDVGQGDAWLLRLGGGREVLIDGGGTPFSDWDVGAAVVVPALVALGVDELELVVATHADADHIEGLASVLRELPVNELAIGHAAPDRALYRDLMAAAEARGVPVRELRRGEVLELGDARLEVLHPGHATEGEVNDASVALALWWRGRPEAVLLGDVSARVEAGLAAPPARVLAVAHHGSSSSTSAALLAAVRPEVAIISAGRRNRFGHPAPEVVARLEAAGARVRTTVEEGAVRVPLGR